MLPIDMARDKVVGGSIGDTVYLHALHPKTHPNRDLPFGRWDRSGLFRLARYWVPQRFRSASGLVLEYNPGRRIDLHLKPGEATIAGRLPGERLYRIEIAVRGRRKEALFASQVRS